MGQGSKVAIIGVGLLGGSIALGLKGKKAFRLVGWNHRASSRRRARRLLKVEARFEDAVSGARIVLLCAHSSTILPDLRRIPSLADPDVLIMDVSSVKGEIVRSARKVRGIERHFVPCHPMAGKESSGPANADPNLYRGRVLFMTPLPGTPPSTLRKARAFWRALGAKTVLVDARTHDRIVALTSHLPHLLAAAMMQLFGKKGGMPSFGRGVGSGFRDFTRIAAGNPAMWRDIIQMNHREIRAYLDTYRRELGRMSKRLDRGHGAYWSSFFTRAQSLRERLP